MIENNKCDYKEMEKELDEIEEKREKCIIAELTEIVKKGHKFEVYLNYPINIFGNNFAVMGSYIAIYHDKFEIAFLPLHIIRLVGDFDGDKK